MTNTCNWINEHALPACFWQNCQVIILPMQVKIPSLSLPFLLPSTSSFPFTPLHIPTLPFLTIRFLSWSRFVRDFVATISTCRDGLKAWNFPTTFPFHGQRPRLAPKTSPWQVSVKCDINSYQNKKFELVLKRCVKAYSNSSSQIVLVNFQPFHRNSLLKCALQQNIAKINKTPYFEI